MKKFHLLSVLSLVLVRSLVLAPVAYAHPLGNFTINHYAGLRISRDRIEIDYVLDMAEIPAFQEISAIDLNGNGISDPDEIAAYRHAQCESIRQSLELEAGGQATKLSLQDSSLEFPAGQGGLTTLRLSCLFEAAVSALNNGSEISFADWAFFDRLGWREIVVEGNGVTLQGEFTSTSKSDRLTSYPRDMLSSPLNQRKLTLQVVSAVAANLSSYQPGVKKAGSSPIDRNDAFTRLITMENITLPTLMLALLISMVWGAMHALTPGHGKTIVGAYLVGSRGTAKHAVILGLTTTLTHTAGVYLLGVVTLLAARYILPEKIFPWLSLLSGVFVVGIGFNLLVARLRKAINLQPSAGGYQRSGVSEHVSEHHSVSFPLHRSNNSRRTSRISVRTRSVHRSLEDHVHNHDHGHYHIHAHDHAHDHPQINDHTHDHSHGGHTHLIPGADGTPITWRSLIALGVSGGLLPCPSALVVLLSAVALNRIVFGLVLVLAFSVGLAVVLTGIGLIFVYARRWFERFPSQGRLFNLIPAVSALFILLVGLGIAARSLLEMGWVIL